VRRKPYLHTTSVAIGVVCALLLTGAPAGAQQKGEKSFSALVTDAQGIETEVKNLLFYWEEKVSETAFVPHELKQVPVKRGTATVNVRFDTIKQIEVMPGPDKAPPVFTITLTNGKTGEFALAIAGSFKGESDFGEVELPANGIKKIVFK
jgi:hypothetical protein